MSHRRKRPLPPRPAVVPPTSGPPPTSLPPPTPRDTESFIDAVANGEFDRHIDALAEAVSRRVVLLQAAREAILMATLRKGDRVRINHSARPQYLHGEPGTVIDWAGDNVVVRLDQPIGRFVNGEVRCPPGVLEPLGPGPE